MTRRGQDVSHLHCQSRTNNIKFVIYSAVSASQILLPQRDLGYMRTHTPTGAGAHHTCGTHLLCRHSLKPALAGKMCNTIALETMGTPGSQEKTCLVIYCCIFNSHCRQAAFCSSSSTGVTPKPTSHLNA